MSCSSLAETFAVSLQEFQSFQSVVPDVGAALGCCGCGGSIRSRLWVTSMQKKGKSIPGSFFQFPHVCLSFKAVVGKVPKLTSSVALGSPPLGSHEDSPALAASPWPANSVLENTQKREVGRDRASGKRQRHGALQDGRRLTWRSICGLQLRRKPTTVPRVTVWISVAFPDPGVR